jgi:hypothetical protein
MNESREQLAKIYYQNREVKRIEIIFDDLFHRIGIGSATHISGKDEIITMDYYFIPHDDSGNKEKEVAVAFWEIKNHLDKVEVNHIIDSGIMIEWFSSEGKVNRSLFIPMERILSIDTDSMEYDYEIPAKGIIDR